MSDLSFPLPARQRGVSLIEVLVTMVVLAFGLLGLAAFQSKAQVGSIESYQRAQAAVLLQDMQSRLSGNSLDADAYVTARPLGTSDGLDPDCSAQAAGSARDKCEWSAALKGAAEQRSGVLGGAMEGARGCIERVREKNEAAGVCTPAVYLVSVAWQGRHATRAPAQSCGKDAYGADTNRRVISARVAVGLPTCV
ncbi:type IV pilus modification protein PilV [Massilia litorea]|uniref:Type IV pilus modification protein PilV n=1 Tax=Massilia litorea TaxID=2769491 RepID=A0A7L9U282_9BURK|nr:type IV pilus modification protein PilV [Massilia litorea]QOL48392.1 type IV pilus modification protein PilV [Massilia litorea]